MASAKKVAAAPPPPKTKDQEKIAMAVRLCNIAASQLGWKKDGDWDGEHGIKKTVGGHLSLTKMNLKELNKILALARKCGWKAKYKKPDGGTSRALDRRPQAQMVRGLWLELARMGEVREAGEEALAAWVKRQTRGVNDGTGLDALDWVADAGLTALVESLKQWRVRALKKGEFVCADCGVRHPPVDIRVALFLRDGNEARCPLCESRLDWRRTAA